MNSSKTLYFTQQLNALLWILLLLSLNQSYGQGPISGDPRDCNYSCSSNDVRILEVYLSNPGIDDCTLGEMETSDLCIVVQNNTQNDRFVYIASDVYIDGDSIFSLIYCFGEVLAGTTDTFCLIDTIDWICGQEVMLTNTWLGWSAANGSCPDPNPTCSGGKAYIPSGKCGSYGDVTVRTPLIPNFSFETACTGEAFSTVTFTNLTTGGYPPLSYSWDFGDGNTSTDTDPVHTYTSSGSYTVILKVTDDENNMKSDTQTVEVIACCSLEVTCPTVQTLDCDDTEPSPGTYTIAQFVDEGGTITGQCGTIDIVASNIGYTSCGGTFTRQYIVYDFDDVLVNGTYDVGVDILHLSHTCASTWTVNDDTQAPTTTCPTDQVIIVCNPDPSAYAPVTVTWSDNCNTFTSGVIAGTPTSVDGCSYEVTHKYWATDACTNSDTCYQTFSWVEDNTAPTFANCTDGTIADPIDRGCNNPPDEAAAIAAVGDPSDNCGLGANTASASGGAISGDCVKSQTWTVSIDDACGNTGSCTFTFQWIEDDAAPTFANCTDGAIADPIDRGCNNPPDEAAAIAAVGDPSDNCGLGANTASASGGAISGDCVKSQTWTVSIDDACGNTGSCTVTFQWIEDDAAPTFANCTDGAIADPIDRGCNNPPDEAAAIAAVGDPSDNCGLGANTASASGGAISGDCVKSQTWTVSIDDACGNTGSCTVTFQWIEDDAAPTFANCTDGAIADPIDRGCNNPPDEAAAIAAVGDPSDNCGLGANTASASGGAISGDCVKSQTWTVSIDDACGNTGSCTVTFQWTDDDAAPTFANCTDGAITDPIYRGCNNPPDEAAAIAAVGTASDNCGLGANTASASGGAISGDCVKSQTWTVSIDDACGNTGSCTVTFEWIEDDAAPTFANCTDGAIADPIDRGCNNPPDEAAAIAAVGDPSDNCGLGANTASASGGAISGDCVKSQTWTVSIDDACENTGSCTVTFQWIEDDAAPTFANCTDGAITDPIDRGCNNPPDEAAAIAAVGDPSDNCGLGANTASASGGAISGDCVKSQTWTVSIDDPCGNTGSCTVTFQWIEDDAAPTFANCTDGTITDPIYRGCNNPPNEAAAIEAVGTASDNCGLGANTASATGGAISGDCVKSQTWTVSIDDACGNTGSCTVTFQWIEDDAAPTFANCTDGAITDPIDRGCNNPPDEAAAIAAVGDPSDNCGLGANTASASGGAISGDCVKSQTWTVSIDDACGNTGSCTVTFQWIEDDAAPTFANCTDGAIADPIDRGCNNPPDEAAALAAVGVASDNCGLGTAPASASMTSSTTDGCVVTEVWTATIEDACGNLGSCQVTFVHIVQDPLQLSCPATVNIEADDQPTVDAAFDQWLSEFSHAGGCNGDAAFFVDGVEVDTSTLVAPEYCEGDITLKMVVTSDCQKDSCESSFNIIVQSHELQISIPVEIATCRCTIPSALDVPPARTLASLLNVTVVDPCIDQGSLSLSTLLTGPEVEGNMYTFTRTYMVTGDNLIADPVQEFYHFELQDEESIFQGVPADLELACGDELPEWPDVTAFDGNGVEVMVIPSTRRLYHRCGGDVIERRWTAFDECGCETVATQRIYYRDDVAPVLTVPNDTTIQCGDGVPAPWYEVTDNCSGAIVDLHESIEQHNECEFTLTRIWTAKDECYNVTRDTQIIQIIDTIAPEIYLDNPMMYGVENGDIVEMYGCMTPQVAMADPVVEDGCCSAEVVFSDDLIAHATCDIFGYHSKWRCSVVATDAAGNTSEFFFYVLQYDTTAPVIHNVPANIEVECGDDIPPVDSTVYLEDDCSSIYTPDFHEEITVDPTDDSKMMIVRTWSGQDLCGNYTEMSQIIRVCDYQASQSQASVSSSVWFDTDNNGIRDVTDEGLNDVDVTLYRANPADVENPILIATKSTATLNGVKGQVTFSHLAPDTYMVHYTTPEGLEFVEANQGNDDEADSDADPTSGMSEEFTVHANEDIDHIDAGFAVSKGAYVQLAGFGVSSNGCYHTILWNTGFESVNLSHFEVQFSRDGMHFESIKSVNPKGSESSRSQYEFTDPDRRGEGYYRLKLVRMDGEITFSDTKYIRSRCAQERNIAFYPNPVRSALNIEFDAFTSGDAMIEIFDRLGRIMKTQRINAFAGANRQEIDLEILPQGTYFIKLSMSDWTEHKMIVKTE